MSLSVALICPSAASAEGSLETWSMNLPYLLANDKVKQVLVCDPSPDGATAAYIRKSAYIDNPKLRVFKARSSFVVYECIDRVSTDWITIVNPGTIIGEEYFRGLFMEPNALEQPKKIYAAGNQVSVFRDGRPAVPTWKALSGLCVQVGNMGAVKEFTEFRPMNFTVHKSVVNFVDDTCEDDELIWEAIRRGFTYTLVPSMSCLNYVSTVS